MNATYDKIILSTLHM